MHCLHHCIATAAAVQAAKFRAGQGRAGQGRAGQGRAGQGRAGCLRQSSQRHFIHGRNHDCSWSKHHTSSSTNRMSKAMKTSSMSPTQGGV